MEMIQGQTQREVILTALLGLGGKADDAETLFRALVNRNHPHLDGHDTTKQIWRLQKAGFVRFRETHRGLRHIMLTPEGLAAAQDIQRHTDNGAARPPTPRMVQVWEAYHRLGSQGAAARELHTTQGGIRTSLLGYMKSAGMPTDHIPPADPGLIGTVPAPSTEVIREQYEEAHPRAEYPEVDPGYVPPEEAPEAPEPAPEAPELDEATQTQLDEGVFVVGVLEGDRVRELGHVEWDPAQYPLISEILARHQRAQRVQEAIAILQEVGEDDTALGLMVKTEFSPLELEVIALHRLTAGAP